MNIPWKYIGCSDQSVPSLSKVAMRSPGATKSGPPSVVAAVTKSTIACLVGPSFQDGSGSSWAKAGAREDEGEEEGAAHGRVLQATATSLIRSARTASASRPAPVAS